MSFTWPWALLGLAALPALVLIYWLRQRARRLQVSSLMFWPARPEPASGRRFERFEAPLLFLLELLILLLLIAAAVGPRILRDDARRPLAVVLDDSISMRAGGEDSARRLALDAVRREAVRPGHGSLTLITAGKRPEILADDLAPSLVEEKLAAWTAMSTEASIDAALVLARRVAGDRARLLVISDRPPPQPEALEDLRWWAFGTPRPNAALLTAARTRTAVDHLLLEARAFANRPMAAHLRLSAADRELASETLRLEPGATVRRRFEVTTAQPVRLELTAEGDAFDVDDEVLLLPETARPVRVDLRLDEGPLRRSVEAALAATGRARLGPHAAEIIITDDPDAPTAQGAVADAWSVRFESSPDPVTYLGPYVIDHRHPLSDGLSLGGVLWAAPAGGEPGGRALISAGETPLVTERQLSGGGREIALRLEASTSTLERSPAWPALWWNLLEWRSRSAPGPRRANLRLGEEILVTLPPGVLDAEVIEPGEAPRRLAAPAGEVRHSSRRLGGHEVRAGELSWPLSVALLNPDESDLTGAASGRWGSWSKVDVARDSRSVAWIPALLALALLAVHLAFTAAIRHGAPR